MTTADRIRRVRLRATPQRIAVLDAFEGIRSQTLAETRERLDPAVRLDLVTLYRTLASFREAGLLHSLRIGSEERFFACGDCAHAPDETANDVHIDYCRACGSIRERHGHHAHEESDVVSCRQERVLSRCPDCPKK